VTTIVLWVENLEAAANFYSALLNGEKLHASEDFVNVSSKINSVLLHKVPDQYAVGITVPPLIREDSVMKPVFEVGSIEAARQSVTNTSGQIKSSDTEQSYGDIVYCDGFDPEGNVIQLAQKL
jgi:predicted enzyme related to lactoylglutathione lyase